MRDLSRISPLHFSRLGLVLLADTHASYDADDSASKPQQAVKEEIPEPAVTPTPNQNLQDSNHVKEEPLSEITQEDQVNGNYTNGQGDDSAMNWSNGQTDGYHNNHYGDAPAESQGIGIKEDG